MMSFFYDDDEDEDILFGWEFDTFQCRYIRVGNYSVPFPRPPPSGFQQANIRPLYVRNLPANIDGYGLACMFFPFGTVTRTKLVPDRFDYSKQFGFVWFCNDQEANRALYWMNGRWIEGSQLYVAPAEYREDRRERLDGGDDDDEDDILYGWVYDVYEKAYKQIYPPQQCAPFPEPMIPVGYPQKNVRPLYVGNLSWEIDSDDLYNLFSPFGCVTYTEIATDNYGDSRGFGYVTFSSDEETNFAMYWMDERDVDGNCLDVELANCWYDPDDYRNNLLYGWEYDVLKKSFVQTAPDCAPFPSPLKPSGPFLPKVQPLFVGNLTPRIDGTDLRIIFSTIGTVTRTELVLDSQGKSQGFGYVWMTSREEIDYAISWMHGRYVDGLELSVELAKSDGPPPREIPKPEVHYVPSVWSTESSCSSKIQTQTAAHKLQLAKPGSAAA